MMSLEGPNVVSDLAMDPLEVKLKNSRLRRMRRAPKPILWFSFFWIGFLLLLAFTVQWWPIHSPTTTVGIPNLSPVWGKELFGTDTIGRSVLSRLAYGARISILISFSATAISAVIGSILGLLAVYFRGITNTIVDILANTLLSIPGFLLLLAIVLALGPSVTTITLALSVYGIPGFMRLMRTNADSQISREYILSARSMGATPRRIIFRELLPNTAPMLLSYAAIVLPQNLIAEGGLSFLGFGVQPPTPSWGGTIALGAQNLRISPWPALIACLILTVTVFALNTVGDNLRSRLDVREAKL